MYLCYVAGQLRLWGLSLHTRWQLNVGGGGFSTLKEEEFSSRSKSVDKEGID